MNRDTFRDKQLKYWRKRNNELHKAVDLEADEVITSLRRAYKEAEATINQNIAQWYQKLADNNEISLADAKKWLSADELADFKMTLNEYIRHGEDLDVDPSWRKAMINASSKHHISSYEAQKMLAQAEIEEAVAKIDGSWIDRAAETAYLHRLYDVQIAKGTMFRAPNVDRAVRSAKRPWTPDGMEFVERAHVNNAKLVQKIHRDLTQAAITGESYETTARRISKDFELTVYESVRIVRTESCHIETEASMQAYRDCGIDQYQVLATLDRKTCEICAEMDMKVVNLSDRMDGYNAPPFHPNCRCTTIAYFADMKDDGTTRAGRNEEGRNVPMDGSMTYDEWAEQYANDADKEYADIGEAGRLAKKAKAEAAKEELLHALKNSVTIGKPYIDPERITDPEFSRKFSRITDNSRINDVIRSHAQGCITKNNGTYTEILDIIDADTGKLIIHKLGEKDGLSISLTAEEKALIKGYEGRLVSIHNHPTNIPPTGSDFVTAGSRGYDYGVIVTHDLKVYVYKPPSEPISTKTIDSIIDKHTRMLYNDDEKREGLEEARKELERRFGITWQEIV